MYIQLPDNEDFSISKEKENILLSEGENSIQLIQFNDGCIKIILNLVSYKSIHMFGRKNDNSFDKYACYTKQIIKEYGFSGQTRLLLLRAMSWI